ncbi:MAG: hypothetical protein A2087_10215 [Spirochaetes bacterium GWD1_61_31]|nr:MAG: hypothetical protein A2Y37_12300 [Spirochaetes bacterium GWB1_60_80]OHD30154.1 MAG: hypothetical protein A2004_14165 [Spirochaetes bacterium GWC1_61_12]OHD34591.1 MAG: hypothetical protein A2087_10215 [Spirochaetes bacterium GWD1_61_31]OHD46407.1 MAG: hypothetical protein A2Y35_10120 [Spirochaetes bacterium GWE1_60_18]OHD59463.1 MAG: hypothetical protein A2Y32_10075 [Spirochaetes bacterium GWF1_60_12]HAP43543.1 hypothetical protein [Spirochaetaceae bacterium]
MTTPFESANEALIQIQREIAIPDWPAAFDTATLASKHFPGTRGMIEYFRLCAAARLGRRELVFDSLRQLADEGFWYSEVLLRQSPSFAPFQELPDFERLVERHRAVQEHSMAARQPDIIVRPASSLAVAAALIALHGNAGSAALEAAHWTGLTAQACLVGLPESGQGGLMKDVWNWDDEAATFATIRTFHERLALPIGTPLLLGGFSLGGQMALRAALNCLLPCRGFLLFAPYIDANLTEWLKLLQKPAAPSLRGHVVVGSLDPSCAAIRQLVAAMNQVGLVCGLEVLAGAHDYPTDLAAIFGRALPNVLVEPGAPAGGA